MEGADKAAEAPSPVARRLWPRRYTIVALFFASTVICYIDRVNISVAIIPMARGRGYDAAAQGLVLSGFFWGYLLSQLAGGWLADRFGGKRVLAFGVATWSIATILTPGAAGMSLAMLLAARAALGLGEGVNFPAIFSLAVRWTEPSERSRALALNYSGGFLGTVLALLLTPVIILRLGWPAAFYTSGALGAIWLGVWGIKAADRPEDCRGVSAEELAAITADRPEVERAEVIPWRRILAERSVWAIVLAHTCNNWGFYILLLWLPTYLSRSLGVALARVGNWALVPWAAMFVCGNLGGVIADALIARRWSVTAARKSIQSIGFIGGAIPLLVLPQVASVEAAVALVTLSLAASSLGLGGWGVNHLDVGPRYAGVLMGISNTAATVPGIVGVAATGLILRATGSFAPVFYLTAAVYALGLAAYLAWASGERRL